MTRAFTLAWPVQRLRSLRVHEDRLKRDDVVTEYLMTSWSEPSEEQMSTSSSALPKSADAHEQGFQCRLAWAKPPPCAWAQGKAQPLADVSCTDTSVFPDSGRQFRDPSVTAAIKKWSWFSINNDHHDVCCNHDHSDIEHQSSS